MRGPPRRAQIGRGRLSAAIACALALAVSDDASAQTSERRAPGVEQPKAAAGAASGKPEAGKPTAGRPANGSAQAQPAAAPPAPAGPQKFDIDEYEVQGADKLPQIEVEEAIYPFLGPDRTPEDVEKARAALEKAYQAKGFQTVSVSVPPQNVERRVIVLKVAEVKVGRLRVKGSRYFDQEKILKKAPSLNEGEVPDFDDVTKDVTALNQWPDRRVTPALRAGVKPGTVDVDLNVEDTLPFHASVELNNRQTPNTSSLRLSGTARYENLWQLGHSLTLNYTVAPERPKDAQSFSASYLARLPDNDQLSFLFSALKSDSDLIIPLGETGSGSANVVGPTAQLGARAVITLPGRENFFHTFNVGGDYKESDSDFNFDEFTSRTPINYVTAAAAYNATYQAEKSLTQFNADLTLGVRGLGSDTTEFGEKRFRARADFFVLKGDVAHTQELPAGFQLYGKVQGQASDQPLVSSEQFSLGGLDSVRGYLETEAVGDTGAAGTIEFRSPNLATYLPAAAAPKEGESGPKFTPLNELRVFGFIDAGMADIYSPQPEQAQSFELWSVGVGANIKSFDYVNGSVVLALPMTDGDYSDGGDPRVLFRFWGEF